MKINGDGKDVNTEIRVKTETLELSQSKVNKTATTA